MPKAKAHQLRAMSADELLKKVQKEKDGLATLRVGFDPKTHQSRVGKIKVTRKNIARALTIYHEKRREAAALEYANKKRKPRDMMPKMTRRMRQKLTKEQASKVVAKVAKRRANYPERRFVVLA